MIETLTASVDAVVETAAASVDAVVNAVTETLAASADAVINAVKESAAAVVETAPADVAVNTLSKGGSSMHFEGVAGAINVSIVAFSIVFGVLVVLTGVIYGMKLFAGSPDEKKNDVAPAKPSSSPKPAPAKASAPSADKAKIVAAITAAIIEFTGSADFRILSVQPEGQVGRDYWTSRWKTAGMLNLNSNRLTRKWH